MTPREEINDIKNQLNLKDDEELAKILNTSVNNIYSYASRGIPNKIHLKLQKIGVNISNAILQNAMNVQPINKNGVKFFSFENPDKDIFLPLWNTPISHGTPNAILDDTVTHVNATKHLHADSFYVEAKGRSMEGAGIKEGDRILIDKRVEQTNGRIVLARVNGEYTVKRLKTNGKTWLLHPDSDENFPVIECDSSVEIIGVAVRTEHKL